MLKSTKLILAATAFVLYKNRDKINLDTNENKKFETKSSESNPTSNISSEPKSARTINPKPTKEVSNDNEALIDSIKDEVKKLSERVENLTSENSMLKTKNATLASSLRSCHEESKRLQHSNTERKSSDYMSNFFGSI